MPRERARTAGHAVQLARKERSITGHQLAYALGPDVTDDDIRQMEGGSRPSTEKLGRALAYLEVDLDQLGDDLLAAYKAILPPPGLERVHLLHAALLMAHRAARTGKIGAVTRKGTAASAPAGKAPARLRVARLHDSDTAGELGELVRLEGFEPPTPSSGNWCFENSASEQRAEVLTIRRVYAAAGMPVGGWHGKCRRGHANGSRTRYVLPDGRLSPCRVCATAEFNRRAAER